MLKLTAKNIAAFLILWLAVLVLTVVGTDIWRLGLKPLFESADSRSKLPVYADTTYAKKIFEDQDSTESDYVPFIEWRRKPFASQTLNIDGRGYRLNGRYEVQDTVGKTALGIFGGSTTWGVGVDDSGTVPAFFQSLDPRFDVTNYGEGGFTARQNLDELINLAVARSVPKVVVFYNGFNDIWIHCNYAITESLNGHNEERSIRRALLSSGHSSSSIYRNLIEPVVDFVFELSDRKKIIPACSTDPKRAQAVAEMLVQDWLVAHDIVTREGGQFYAFLQPIAAVGSPNISYLNVSKNRWLRSDEYRAVYPMVLNIIRERQLSWVFDLTKALDGDGRYYIDDCHLTPDGNRIIAQEIYRNIRSNIELAAQTAGN